MQVLQRVLPTASARSFLIQTFFLKSRALLYYLERGLSPLVWRSDKVLLIIFFLNTAEVVLSFLETSKALRGCDLLGSAEMNSSGLSPLKSATLASCFGDLRSEDVENEHPGGRGC